MVNGFSRKVLSTVVASSLLLSAGGAVVSAAPKEDKKDTGRTEQQVMTGVLSNNDVTVERYQKEVRLSGTVVIDGPQLVFSISGVNSEDIKITKIGDKTWMYDALVDVQAIKGNTDFEISAKTIYPNGKNAGAVHTSAPTVTQTIHVPYVTSTVAENTKWTAYNRSSNEFTLSYNEVENWSVGDPVVTPKSLDVSGTKEDVKVLDTTVEVPTAIQGFTFSDEATWEFIESTKTFSATFDVFITDSKGVITKKSVTEAGLAPGEVHSIPYTVTDKFGSITNSKEYSAPVAPVVDVYVDELKDFKFKLIKQNENQFKIEVSYQIIYSNKETVNKEDVKLDGNFGNPTKGNQNDSSKNCNIEGLIYKVTVNYDTNKKDYYVTYEYVGRE